MWQEEESKVDSLWPCDACKYKPLQNVLTLCCLELDTGKGIGLTGARLSQTSPCIRVPWRWLWRPRGERRGTNMSPEDGGVGQSHKKELKFGSENRSWTDEGWRGDWIGTGDTVSEGGCQVWLAWEELRTLGADCKISHLFLLDVGKRELKITSRLPQTLWT